MANLDIAIVMFALIVTLILDILAIGLKNRYFAFLGMIFAISALGYFISNFTQVSIGTTITISFQLFIIAWVILPILSSFILGVSKIHG